MAIFKISSTGAAGTLPSVFTNTGSAFFSDSAAADTLIVDAGAFLIATGALPGNAGANLANSGAWTVAVNGIVIGANGIELAAGNAAASSIAVGAAGTVSGTSYNGIVTRSSATINNSGTIVGVVNGVSIEGGAASWITNAGSIIGVSNAIFDFSGLSSDTVANSGTISGNVDLAGGTNTLTNSGLISGLVAGGAGNDKVTNSNSITKQVELGVGTNTLANSGNIGNDGAGVSVFGGASGSDSVTNSGTISASISLLDGTNTVFNSGIVGMDADHQSYAGGSGTDTVSNTAVLLGGVNMAGGSNTLINSGTVGTLTGYINNDGASYTGSADADSITNSGTLLGAINAGDGVNAVSNRGTIGFDVNGDSIVTGAGADGIANAARVGKWAFGGTISGDVVTGDGNDTVSDYISFKYKAGMHKVGGKLKIVWKTAAASGQINGVVDLGAGNDAFYGGAYSESVKDGDGSDYYALGGGDDRYIATGATANLDGYDVIDGGAGLLDVYDASAAVSGGVVINLDTVAHAETSTGIGVAVVIANQASGIDVVGQPPSNLASPYDRVTNFENVRGTQFSDIIFGSGAANEFAGNAGDDHLWGLGGNDLINGGAGADAIIGGAGADTLAGGAGDDTFWYFAASDSGTTAATRDLIADFAGGAGGDVIDLSMIDANSKIAGNDTFNFIGTNVAFGGTAGELRATWSAIGQIIEGDINGDKVADFSIAIIDVGHTIDLSNANGVDFVL